MSNIWQIGQQAVAFRKPGRPSRGRPEPTEKPGKPAGEARRRGRTRSRVVGPVRRVAGGAGEEWRRGVQGWRAAAKGGTAKAGGAAKAGGGGGDGQGWRGGQGWGGGEGWRPATSRPKPAAPKKPGSGGSGGGSTRPPSGRVTPKGGGSGRVTPKGGPGGPSQGSGDREWVWRRRRSEGIKGELESASAPSTGSRYGVACRIVLAKAKRPPPAARPKGLPPTKGSSGGSSRKES